MDIEKYMDKRIRVKFAGGREGELLPRSLIHTALF